MMEESNYKTFPEIGELKQEHHLFAEELILRLKHFYRLYEDKPYPTVFLIVSLEICDAIFAISFIFRCHYRQVYYAMYDELIDAEEFEKFCFSLPVERGKRFTFNFLFRISFIFELTMYLFKEGYDYFDIARRCIAEYPDVLYFDAAGGWARVNAISTFMICVSKVWEVDIAVEHPLLGTFVETGEYIPPDEMTFDIKQLMKESKEIDKMIKTGITPNYEKDYFNPKDIQSIKVLYKHFVAPRTPKTRWNADDLLKISETFPLTDRVPFTIEKECDTHYFVVYELFVEKKEIIYYFRSYMDPEILEKYFPLKQSPDSPDEENYEDENFTPDYYRCYIDTGEDCPKSSHPPEYLHSYESEEDSHDCDENSHESDEDCHESDDCHESGEDCHESGEDCHESGEDCHESSEDCHESSEDCHDCHDSGEDCHECDEDSHEYEESSHSHECNDDSHLYDYNKNVDSKPKLYDKSLPVLISDSSSDEDDSTEPNCSRGPFQKESKNMGRYENLSVGAHSTAESTNSQNEDDVPKIPPWLTIKKGTDCTSLSFCSQLDQVKPPPRTISNIQELRREQQLVLIKLIIDVSRLSEDKKDLIIDSLHTIKELDSLKLPFLKKILIAVKPSCYSESSDLNDALKNILYVSPDTKFVLYKIIMNCTDLLSDERNQLFRILFNVPDNPVALKASIIRVMNSMSGCDRVKSDLICCVINLSDEECGILSRAAASISITENFEGIFPNEEELRKEYRICSALYSKTDFYLQKLQELYKCTGMQKTRFQIDEEEIVEREIHASMQKEKEAILQREREAILQREREAALQKQRDAALHREIEAIMQMEREAAMQKRRDAAIQREREAAMQKQREILNKSAKDDATAKQIASRPRAVPRKISNKPPKNTDVQELVATACPEKNFPSRVGGDHKREFPFVYEEEKDFDGFNFAAGLAVSASFAAIDERYRFPTPEVPIPPPPNMRRCKPNRKSKRRSRK